MLPRSIRTLALALLLPVLGGCGVVAIRDRPPLPPNPPPRTRPVAGRPAHRPVQIAARPAPALPESARAVPRRLQYTRHARATLAQQLARDTLVASAAVHRCRGALMPDEESTRDAVTTMLTNAHLALRRGDLAHALSYARDARQLSTALRCR